MWAPVDGAADGGLLVSDHDVGGDAAAGTRARLVLSSKNKDRMSKQ